MDTTYPNCYTIFCVTDFPPVHKSSLWKDGQSRFPIRDLLPPERPAVQCKKYSRVYLLLSVRWSDECGPLVGPSGTTRSETFGVGPGSCGDRRVNVEEPHTTDLSRPHLPRTGHPLRPVSLGLSRHIRTLQPIVPNQPLRP